MRLDRHAVDLLGLAALVALKEVAVVHVYDEPPGRRELRGNLAQQRGVRRLIEVAQALPHVDDGIEGAGERGEVAHVAKHECHLLMRLRGAAPGFRKRRRVAIESRYGVPTRGQPRGMASVAATEVQHTPVARQWELAGKEGNILLCPLLGLHGHEELEPAWGIDVGWHRFPSLLCPSPLASIPRTPATSGAYRTKVKMLAALRLS